MRDSAEHPELWLAHWWPDASTPVRLTGGTTNCVYAVQAGQRRAILRLSNRPAADVERELALLAVVRERGIPVPVPLATTDGALLVANGQSTAVLLTHLEGATLADRPDRPTGALLGTLLARIHSALEDCPPALAQKRSFAVDRAASLADADDVRNQLVVLPDTAERDRMLAHVQQQRQYIEWASPARPDALLTLPQQVIHGDMQLNNVLFRGQQISGVIGWDQAYVAPRAWEVMRAIHLIFDFARKPAESFLAAYRALLPLPTEELDQAAIWYSHLRAHDFWLFRGVLAGNTALLALLPPKGFTPLIERWAMSDLK